MSDGFTRFGRYLLIDPLSSGGMGYVHLALDPDGQPCVVKRLHDESANDPERQRRFAREAALSRRLVHDNLVRLLDDGHVNGTLFLVQEYVRGADLALFLSRLGTQALTLPICAAAHIVTLLCRGLHHLHGFEDGTFIHRDVSPSNIQLAFDGNVKLLDFGLAKGAWDCDLTTPGATLGKLAYMAPEQIRGEPLDRRADVYAAGAVFWELLTGGRLVADHIESSAEDTVRRLCEGQVPPPSRFNPEVTPALDALLLQALARRREDRLPDARTLAVGAARFSRGGKQALLDLLRNLFHSDAAEARYTERLAEARAALRSPGARHPSPARSVPWARGVWLLVGAALGLATGAAAIVTTRRLIGRAPTTVAWRALSAPDSTAPRPAPLPPDESGPTPVNAQQFSQPMASSPAPLPLPPPPQSAARTGVSATLRHSNSPRLGSHGPTPGNGPATSQQEISPRATLALGAPPTQAE